MFGNTHTCTYVRTYMYMYVYFFFALSLSLSPSLPPSLPLSSISSRTADYTCTNCPGPVIRGPAASQCSGHLIQPALRRQQVDHYPRFVQMGLSPLSLSVAGGGPIQLSTKVFSYLKGTIVCKYCFGGFFATGGKNTKLSTRI